MSERAVEKAEIQENQYTFPYHYIPDVNNKTIITNRIIRKPMIYMSYIGFVRDEVINCGTKSILDVGCGDGRMLYELENKDPDRTYFGIDISERALQFARGFTQHSKFEVFDIINAPYPTQFDACTYIETIEHIEPEKIKPMIANMAASLKPGGVMYLTTPTTNLPTANKHFQHFTKESIEKYIGEHFTLAEVRYFNVENGLAKFLNGLLLNRIFILNFGPFRRTIFGMYMKHCFIGTAKTGSRIYVKAIKK
jgi:SAM-dependent methyltransferase